MKFNGNFSCEQSMPSTCGSSSIESTVHNDICCGMIFTRQDVLLDGPTVTQTRCYKKFDKTVTPRHIITHSAIDIHRVIFAGTNNADVLLHGHYPRMTLHFQNANTGLKLGQILAASTKAEDTYLLCLVYCAPLNVGRYKQLPLDICWSLIFISNLNECARYIIYVCDIGFVIWNEPAPLRQGIVNHVVSCLCSMIQVYDCFQRCVKYPFGRVQNRILDALMIQVNRNANLLPF